MKKNVINPQKKLVGLSILLAISSCGILVPAGLINAAISGSNKKEESFVISYSQDTESDKRDDLSTDITKDDSEHYDESGEYIAHVADADSEDDGMYDKIGATINMTSAMQEELEGDKEVTSKGYPIEYKDGAAYIDDVLIVNKTFSLPSTYSPFELTDETKDAFDSMQTDAAKADVGLWIQSGYRSYERQSELYNEYTDKYGEELTDTESARPGFSEHQTGLALDVNEISDDFEETKAGRWISLHAHEYGFIIRYPKDKEEYTGYKYEPWHLRYVGKELAKKLYETGECLEEYFGIVSEYGS